MDTIDTLIAVLLCLGGLQGLVYGVMFLRKQGEQRMAYRFLAAILFSLAYQLLCEVLLLFGIGYYDTWYHLTLEFNWIYGPLLYLSVKALVQPQFKWRRSYSWHFLPVAIQLVISIYVRSQNFFWDGTRESLTWLGYWGYDFWMNLPSKYLIAAVVVIYYATRAKRLLRPAEGEDRIELIPENAAWIRRMILVFQVYFLLFFSIVLIDLVLHDVFFGPWYFFFNRFYYFPYFIGVAVLTYGLGMVGFHRQGQPVYRIKPKQSPKGKAKLEQLAQQLRHLMEEEGLFKDPELNLAALAERLGVKSYLVSKCLKQELGTGFIDYVNGLRLAEVRRLLVQPESERYTLLSLALDSGFNSKASFNRAVKKQYDMSPKELREKVLREEGISLNK